MSRTLFALQGLLRHKKSFQALARDAFAIPNIAALKKDSPALAGISHLILDYDGVLSAHDSDGLESAAAAWLADPPVPLENIAIFSNNPRLLRKSIFQKAYPSIQWILPPPKKPYPGAVEKWLQERGLFPESVALVDDRLSTGVLCAMLAKVRPIWVTKPLQNFKAHPIKESYYQMLRVMEKSLLRL